MEAEGSTEKQVKLIPKGVEPNDNDQHITAPLEAMKASTTFRDMLDDLGSTEIDAFPCTNIEPKVLQLVVDYCKLLKANPKPPVVPKKKCPTRGQRQTLI